MAAPLLKTYNQSFATGTAGSVNVTGVLDLSGYEQVSVEIVAGPQAPAHVNVVVYMGKISGWTLSQEMETFPLDDTARIHSYRVIGPELAVFLQGPPNTQVPVQAWVFLR